MLLWTQIFSYRESKVEYGLVFTSLHSWFKNLTFPEGNGHLWLNKGRLKTRKYWGEKNFKIIRHIFSVKEKRTGLGGKPIEFYYKFLRGLKVTHYFLIARCSLCLVFWKILFSLTVLITYSPLLAPHPQPRPISSFKTQLSKRFENLGHVGIPLVDLNPLLNN